MPPRKKDEARAYAPSPLTKLQESILLDRLGGDLTGYTRVLSTRPSFVDVCQDLPDELVPKKVRDAHATVRAYNRALSDLREELRDRLRAVQDEGRSGVVFAKTPQEALSAVEDALAKAEAIGTEFRKRAAKL